MNGYYLNYWMEIVLFIYIGFCSGVFLNKVYNLWKFVFFCCGKDDSGEFKDLGFFGDGYFC